MKIFLTDKQYREAILREIDERERLTRFENEVDRRFNGMRTDLESVARRLCELERNVNDHVKAVAYRDEQ